jgi:predicted CXXCH cytochrome family protein
MSILKKSFYLCAILIVSFLLLSNNTSAAVSTCIECHSDLEGESKAPVDSFLNDVHNRPGIGCVGCHGGDNTSDDIDISMSEESGFIGVPDRKQILILCSKCHSNPEFMKVYNQALPTDQYSKYLTSVHGRLNGAGDTKAADCVSCHQSHGIRSASNPKSSVYSINLPKTCVRCHADKEYMAEYNIPTDQWENYKKSVHGVALLEKKDVGAPACNDCHGNHGAVPPEVESIDKVCGLCHHNNMVDFEKSTHFEYFSALDEPACETCHSNHYIVKATTALLQGEKLVCAKCHDNDDGTGGLESAAMISLQIDSLEQIVADAHQKLNEADIKGLFINDGLFLLKDAQQKVYESKTSVHTFNDSLVVSITNSGMGLALRADSLAVKLLGDYMFRRQGLIVSVFVLCFLAILILLKVRQIKKRQKA